MDKHGESPRAVLPAAHAAVGYSSSDYNFYADNFPVWLTPKKLRGHTMLVIGGRDMEAGAVSVRLHHGGPQGAKPKAEVVADILASIKERRA